MRRRSPLIQLRRTDWFKELGKDNNMEQPTTLGDAAASLGAPVETETPAAETPAAETPAAPAAPVTPEAPAEEASLSDSFASLIGGDRDLAEGEVGGTKLGAETPPAEPEPVVAPTGEPGEPAVEFSAEETAELAAETKDMTPNAGQRFKAIKADLKGAKTELETLRAELTQAQEGA